MTTSVFFPGFDYPASEILKFLTASDLFTIILKNGDIIHFSLDDATLFKEWLIKNNIADIRKEKGWILT
jgi:hypothetical protein